MWSSGSGSVSGTLDEKSWNGPLTRMAARLMPMNVIISVVMISFVWYQALRIAGISVQTAPVTPATKKSTISVSVAERWRSRCGPRPATMAAESRNCPW